MCDPSKERRPLTAVEGMSLSTMVEGFLCFSILGLLVMAVVLAMLAGCVLYPRTVGLYLIVPYYTYTFMIRRDEVKDGNRWARFSQNFVMFRPMRRFLDLEIAPIPRELKEAEGKPDAQFLFAICPHGDRSEYRILMDGMLYQVFPNIAGRIRVLAATVLFRIPVIREFALWTGCVDARRSVAESLLDRGRSVMVVPGGMDEQIRTVRGKEIVYLKRRKGFIKLAMRKGVPVVPVYVFGASDHYCISQALFGLRLWIMKNVGACITLSAGHMRSLTCPLPVKTTIVFGKPLTFPVKEKGVPTTEELDEFHAQFMTELTNLFDNHKARLGYGDRTIEII